MRMIFIIDNSKFIGGGEYSIFKFAEHLAMRNHKVTIFATTKSNFFKNIESRNLDIHFRGKIPRIFKGVGLIDRLWDILYSRLKIIPFIKNEKNIDYIIGYHTISTIKANKIAKKFGVPSVAFVFETPDWMESELGNRWLKEYKGRFKKIWSQTKKSLNTVDIIFSNSDLTALENEKWLAKKIEATIYPGLDTKSIDKIKNVRKEYQIIYVGRLNTYKNVNIAIKALSKIKNPPVFVICGNGEEKQNLEQLAKKLNVICKFKGTIEENEKWGEIKKSLFMVFPSSFEGFGMPPMEALYCGIPCICTDIPIFREVYGNKVEYFKEHDVNELANKIKLLINNQEYARSRGNDGRKYIGNKYDWAKSAKKIEKLLLKFKHEKAKN